MFLFYILCSPMPVFLREDSDGFLHKRSNRKKIGDKFRKLVITNAVGIPVVALGQNHSCCWIFNLRAPSPLLLFALTFVSCMIL